MKKLFSVLSMTLIMGFSSSVFAGGIIHNSNLSPEYARTLTRNGSTDGADIAHYNPAGIVFLPEGTIIAVGNQFIFKKYSHKSDSFTFTDDKPVFLFPSLFAVHNLGRFAVYGAFTVPAGGGTLDYKDGIADTLFPPSDVAVPVEGFTGHYALTLGGAFRLNQNMSIGIGLRGIYAHKTVKVGPITGGIYISDYESNAQGFTGILSFNWKVMDKLHFSLKYEHATILEFEDEGGGGATEPYREDLPPVVSVGFVWTGIRKIKLEFAANVYLNKMADWEGLEDKIKTGFEVAVSAEFRLNRQFAFSGGLLYTGAGADKNSYDYKKPALDAISIGVGLKYSLNEKLDVNAGFLKSFYFEDKAFAANGTELTLNKDINLFSIGITARF
ncbi:outer membrane beta-barrel protein [Myxococcota bacterium]|nr:outer membrane beta-barrel protein [Myxococcota bacterium]MBU1381634.1 outer membrane beta-barrel protein [Myxococcota bacterium]MBU1496911.1 outer membrane beta-barrel protein [Myxococcota bacterium]